MPLKGSHLSALSVQGYAMYCFTEKFINSITLITPYKAGKTHSLTTH